MKTTINFRIETEHKDELELIAEENGENISNLVREIITEYLNEYFSKPVKVSVITMTSVHNIKNFEDE